MVACLLALPACAERRAAPLPDPISVPPQGVTQVAFYPDPDAPRPQLPPGEEILPAAPSHIPPPPYPGDALAAGCGGATIGLRIFVDERGLVSDVKDSPVVITAPGPCSGRFRAEAESALRGWRFRPAEWRHLLPGADMDGDGLPDYHHVTETKAIPVYLDVRIDFEVVAGEGRVRILA